MHPPTDAERYPALVDKYTTHHVATATGSGEETEEQTTVAAAVVSRVQQALSEAGIEAIDFPKVQRPCCPGHPACWKGWGLVGCLLKQCGSACWKVV